MDDFFNSKEILLHGIRKLKLSKIPTPELDARILLSKAINYQNNIYLHNDILISKKEKNIFHDYLNKRIQGKPVSRIIGSRNFWKKNFLINNYTLDPRPDTEVIVESFQPFYTSTVLTGETEPDKFNAVIEPLNIALSLTIKASPPNR